jgi:hypothetical protein
MASLQSARAIVADGPLPVVAEACVAAVGGAILAAYDGVDPWELAREGCAYAAVPMLRVGRDFDRVLLEQPILLVVDDDASVEALAIPRLA